MTDEQATSATPWSAAWTDSQFGRAGFYRTHRAEEEFRTSVHVDGRLAQALADEITAVFNRSDHRDFAVIDIGAGDGSLLRSLRTHLPSEINYVGVDLRTRPDDLPADIHWVEQQVAAHAQEITGRDGEWNGVLIAHEFLDDVPCEVVELDDALRPRVVLVDPSTGGEEIGPRLTDSAAGRYVDDPVACKRWLERWWPPTRPLARREVGLSRDRMWSRLRRVLLDGVAIAIDYGHRLPDRRRGQWDGGTLTGFAGGRPRRPVPDCSVNLSAYVAMDSCAGDAASIVSQASLLEGLPGFRGGLGSYEWLFDPVMQR